MIKLMKDFDKYNRRDCSVTGKMIRPGDSFYVVMVPRQSGNGLMKTKAMSIKAGDALIAEGKAELVSR